MKKIIGFVLAGMAMVALSGCNTIPGQNPDITTLSSVDIKNLKNGYIIKGYDDIHGRNVEFDFCGRYYDYYRDGAATQSGHFRIADGNYYTDSRINMWMNDGHTSYRIDVDDNNRDGLLKVGETYKIKEQNEEIYVESITKDINCD
jgi:predicted small secreted protein